MLTMHADQEVLTSAIRAGASGYLVKDCSTEEIASAVRMAVSGETALSPQLAASMLDEVRRLDRPNADEERIVTRREEEVLQLIADGCSTPEVAEKLYISQKTVKNHLASHLPEARRPRSHPGRAPGRPHGHRQPRLSDLHRGTRAGSGAMGRWAPACPRGLAIWPI